MAITASDDSRSLSSEMSVTPLIGVVLVLLIIFMVIVPKVAKGQDASVPQPPSHLTAVPETDRAIVVSLLHQSGSEALNKINQHVVVKDALPARLVEIYANRARRVMFIEGDDDVSFSQVAEVIDMGHAAGVDQVALPTPKVSEGL